MFVQPKIPVSEILRGAETSQLGHWTKHSRCVGLASSVSVHRPPDIMPLSRRVISSCLCSEEQQMPGISELGTWKSECHSWGLEADLQIGHKQQFYMLDLCFAQDHMLPSRVLYCIPGAGHASNPGVVLANVSTPLVSVLRASVKTWHDNALWFDLRCCSSGTSNAGVVLGWGLRNSAAGHVMEKKGRN